MVKRSGVMSRIAASFRRRRKRWESLCNRCGLCCYERVRKNGRLVIRFGSPCQFLDTETHLCTVYECRFQVCPECRKVTIFHALFSRYLPDSCGYVQAYRKRPFRKPTDEPQNSR